MSYEETVELQRRLDNAKMMGLRALELEKRKQSEKAELKRTQEAEQKKNAAIVEARALASLKSEAAAAWEGSTESFESAWKNGLADRIREDQVIAKMRAGRLPIATLD